MNAFCEWFVSNLNSNIVTILSVIFSGLISLIVTAIYYHMGNRNNLRISVIQPIKRLIKEPCTKENYNKLLNLSKEFSSKYLYKSEKRILMELLDSYQEASKYNNIDVNSKILFSYFGYTLENNGINSKPCPVTDIDYNILDYDYPPDMYYMLEDIRKVLKEQEIYYDPDECERSVINLFNSY